MYVAGRFLFTKLPDWPEVSKSKIAAKQNTWRAMVTFCCASWYSRGSSPSNLLAASFLLLSSPDWHYFFPVKKVIKKTRKNNASPRLAFAHPAVFSGLRSWYQPVGWCFYWFFIPLIRLLSNLKFLFSYFLIYLLSLFQIRRAVLIFNSNLKNWFSILNLNFFSFTIFLFAHF